MISANLEAASQSRAAEMDRYGRGNTSTAACSSCIQIAKLDTIEAMPAPAFIGAKHRRST